MPAKTCTRCRVEKPLDVFARDKNTKDGRSSQCLACFAPCARDRAAGKFVPQRNILPPAPEGHKVCRGCIEPKPLESFAPKATHRDGRASWCNDCAARRRRDRRESDPAWRERENTSNRSRMAANEHAARKAYDRRYPERRAARLAVWHALRDGVITKPDRCEDCETITSSIELDGRHHRGYAEEHWLDVRWICEKCHGREHRKVA